MLVEYEILGKSKLIRGSQHGKKEIISLKGDLLILDIVLIVVGVLKFLDFLTSMHSCINMNLHLTKQNYDMR